MTGLAGHECNAWCEDGVHVSVVWSPDSPSRYLQTGQMLHKDGAGAWVVHTEPVSPECPIPEGRPPECIHGWLVWWVRHT